MSSAVARLALPHPLPFTLEVPARGGFFNAGRVDVVVSAVVRSAVAAKRLRRVFDVFAVLARTGALSGEAISPARSGLRVHEVTQGESGQVRVVIDHAAVDDAAIVVLSNLLLRQRKWLSIEKLQVSASPGEPRQQVGQDPDELGTFPGTYSNPRFTVEGDEPEGEGLAVQVVFAREPSVDAIEALEHGLHRWSDAILRGAYCVPPIEPEDSHIESYDRLVTVVGNTAEINYHNIRAGDAAHDAIANIVCAIDERLEPVHVLRLS